MCSEVRLSWDASADLIHDPTVERSSTVSTRLVSTGRDGVRHECDECRANTRSDHLIESD